MKCPYCKYENGWNNKDKELDDINGEHGNFFALPIKVVRDVYYYTESRTVFGCPKCKKVFISDW